MKRRARPWAHQRTGYILSALGRKRGTGEPSLQSLAHRSALAGALVVGTRGLIGSGKMASALPVVVRVKRKRELAPVDTIVVEAEESHAAKRRARMRLWRRSSIRPCRERWEIPLTSVKARLRAATDPSARLSRGRGVLIGAGSTRSDDPVRGRCSGRGAREGARADSRGSDPQEGSRGCC